MNSTPEGLGFCTNVSGCFRALRWNTPERHLPLITILPAAYAQPSLHWVRFQQKYICRAQTYSGLPWRTKKCLKKVMKFFGKGRKFCPKIKFYLLASFDCFNTLQIWLKNNIHTSSLRGVKWKLQKKKKKRKHNVNSIYYSLLFFVKKQSLGTSKRIFNFLVKPLNISNSFCNPRGIETFYDYPCFFFQVLIKVNNPRCM